MNLGAEIEPQRKKSGPYIIAVDVGTSTTRAGVYDLNRQELGGALVENPLAHPHPNRAEQDANDWWAAAVQSIKGAPAQTQVPLPSVERVLLDMHEDNCIKMAVVPDME